MNCPACGSILKEQTNKNGSTFLVCSGWPECRILGTPELLQRFELPLGEFITKALEKFAELAQPKPLIQNTEQTPPERHPVKLGSFITKVAQFRIAQSKLGKAKTAEEREAIRKLALEAIQS